jgi:DNA invertase Pin-like site-specific DNA recombinase
MPRTAHPMTSISAALQDLREAFEGLIADHAHIRQQLQSLVRNGSSVGGSRRAGRPSKVHSGPKKRGRAFKFTDEQASDFRKQAEGGKSAVTLANELKVSLPTMYSTLKRAGWTGRRGRLAAKAGRTRRGTSAGSKKRGRAFKFSNEQAGEFRKQVEDGKSALALAKELKISLPTMYNTLKRAGWKGTRGRKAKAA